MKLHSKEPIKKQFVLFNLWSPPGREFKLPQCVKYIDQEYGNVFQSLGNPRWIQMGESIRMTTDRYSNQSNLMDGVIWAIEQFILHVDTTLNFPSDNRKIKMYHIRLQDMKTLDTIFTRQFVISYTIIKEFYI